MMVDAGQGFTFTTMVEAITEVIFIGNGWGMISLILLVLATWLLTDRHY